VTADAMTHSIVPVPGKKKPMPEQIPHQAGVAGTLPPPSANGSAPPPQAAAPLRRRRLRTSVSSARTALIVGFLALIVLVIFIIQNADAVKISFLGAQVRISLAVALLIAAIAGALVMATAGTARIAQLRMVMRRDRRRPPQA
jgi:lipopolysaccharide assembly protein A